MASPRTGQALAASRMFAIMWSPGHLRSPLCGALRLSETDPWEGKEEAQAARGGGVGGTFRHALPLAARCKLHHRARPDGSGGVGILDLLALSQAVAASPAPSRQRLECHRQCLHSGASPPG